MLHLKLERIYSSFLDKYYEYISVKKDLRYQQTLFHPSIQYISIQAFSRIQ